MAKPAIKLEQTERCVLRVPAGTDLVEWYFEQGWTDGLPVVPPTRELVAPLSRRSAEIRRRLSTVYRRARRLTARCSRSTWSWRAASPNTRRWCVRRCSHRRRTRSTSTACRRRRTWRRRCSSSTVRSPAQIGMNGDCNAFGSGNRANATIGRALRLVMLNVGGGWPGDLDKSTLGHPGKYTYCVAENEAAQPVCALSCREGIQCRRLAAFVSPPSRRTASLTMSPTTRRASSTASARR